MNEQEMAAKLKAADSEIERALVNARKANAAAEQALEARNAEHPAPAALRKWAAADTARLAAWGLHGKAVQAREELAREILEAA